MRRFLINFRYAWNPHKPKLIFKLIYNFILILLFRKQLLRYVDYSIGSKCNLKCAHCFTPDTDAPRMHWTFFSKVAKECMELGALNFSFQGGEPLIYPDLKHYIAAARPEENLISITTNGTLLTSEKAQELKQAGVDIITISIDDFREKSVIAKAMQAIQTAQSAGLKVTIGMTVTSQSVSSFFTQDFIAYASRHKIILLLIFAIPMGRWAGKTDIMLTPRDINYIRRLEKKYPYVRTDFQANYIHKGCGAGKEIIYIKPDGSVFACPFIDIPFGNVRYRSIKKIRKDMLDITILKNYHPRCIAGEDGGLRRYFTNGKTSAAAI